MRYFALISDYDGTLTDDGRIAEPVIQDLQRLRESGRKLVLLTGREFPNLLSTLPEIALFDRVVAENGAFFYNPATREEKKLAEPPPDIFFQELLKRGVEPLSKGRVIVSTRHPQETIVLEVIRDLGLELNLSFNKGAVMILPSGTNKSTGLVAALNDLGLSPHNVVGIGDAENDHAFLQTCECSVAVSNALPTLKGEVDIVTPEPSGEGVRNIARRIVSNDLADQEDSERHRLLLSHPSVGEDRWVTPYKTRLLVTGTSGNAMLMVVKGFLSQLSERGYQFCMVDPEGESMDIPGSTILGDGHHELHVTQVTQVLEDSMKNALVNMKNLPPGGRPTFFAALIARLLELRARTGRPHWVIINKAHLLLPASPGAGSMVLPQATYGLLLVSGHPDHLFPGVLSSINTTFRVEPSDPL